MASVSVYNMEGAQVGTIELSDSIFAVPVNEHLVHQAVVAQLANKRQGTQIYPCSTVDRRRSCICSNTKRLFRKDE